MKSQSDGLRVQYGCGLSAPPDWVNFDASPTLRIQKLPLIGPFATRNRVKFPATVRYGDVVKGLPVADQSCQAVYCSHVLEHLALRDFYRALRESIRMLKPGGLFRGVLPDLEASIDDYVADRSDRAAMDFMRSTLLGQERRPRGLSGLAASVFGGSEHRWMWDYQALEKALLDAGFKNVRRATFNDAHTEIFASVEDAGRWQGCLGFQAERPTT